MLSKKYFKVFYVILFVISPNIATALKIEKKCGKYIYHVEKSTEDNYFDRHVELYYKKNAKEKKLFYKAPPGILINTACLKDINNRYLMVFQEGCGGNGCSEELYGVFDPNQKKMLIEPIDGRNGNSKEVQELLGYKPPFYSEKIFFCCYNLHLNE